MHQKAELYEDFIAAVVSRLQLSPLVGLYEEVGSHACN